MSIRYAEVKCKICRGPAVAQWQDGDPQDAIDKWLPMLTCNTCYDRMVKRNQAADTIIEQCFRYANSRNPGKIVVEVREVLMLATRAYAEVMREILNAPQIIWSEQFVECLLEKPQECGRMLYKYREEVRRSKRAMREVAA